MVVIVCMLKLLLVSILLVLLVWGLIYFPIWYFRKKPTLLSLMGERGTKRRYIAFIILCFLHLMMQLGSVAGLYDENTPNKDIDILLCKILTFPMYSITEKLGLFNIKFFYLSYVQYIPLALNSIIWVAAICFIMDKANAFKKRCCPSMTAEDLKINKIIWDSLESKGIPKLHSNVVLFSIALVCSFLPYISIFEGGQNFLIFTGIQLITDTSKINAQFGMILAFLAAIIGFILSFMKGWRNALFLIGTGIFGVVMLVWFFMDFRGINAEYHIGFWITLLCFILATGLTTFLFEKSKKEIKQKTSLIKAVS